MNVCKCDRCGKEMNPGLLYLSGGCEIQYKHHIVFMNDYQLCGDCNIAFQNWIKGEPTNGQWREKQD